MRFRAELATLLLVASCGGVGEVEGPRSRSAADLWGRTFLSVAVTQGGEPRPLVPDTRIKLTFENREAGGVVRWVAGCNILGSEVEITAERLRTGEVAGTNQGCSHELHEQDDWLADFFRSDPYWDLSNPSLTLAAGETTIELRD
jgi:heat shock protein HslJ